jgi:hypothetical protein
MMIRPKPYKADEPVRIVRDMNDSTLDQFISMDVAIAMLQEDQLKEVDLGPCYPMSFMYADSP